MRPRGAACARAARRAAVALAGAAAVALGGCAALAPVGDAAAPSASGAQTVVEAAVRSGLTPDPRPAGGTATATAFPVQPGAPAATPTDAAAARPGAGELPAGADGAMGSAAPSVPGLQVEVIAPAGLKALLERHLDIVRLNRLARGEVEGSEWGRLADAAPAQVRDLLATEGHFAPQVSVERLPGASAAQPDLVRLVVVPGPRARIARVTLAAEGDLERDATRGEAYARDTLAAWRAAWALPAGATFRNADWNDAKASALARLRASGYAAAAWTGTAAQVDPQQHEVRIFVAVDSGPLFRLGSLQIEGLVAHDVQTVRELSLARAGTPVTEALLLDFQERLQKAGLFESVTVALDTDPQGADAARVQVRLQEAPLQVWTFGVGATANTGLRTSVEHVYRRVFGFAATSRNKAEWGPKRQSWEGEISTHPGPGLYRNLLGGAIEQLETGSDTVLSQRLRAGRTQDRGRFEQLYFVEVERSKRESALGKVVTVASTVNYHGVWRAVDDVLLPTDGLTFSGQVGLGRSHGSGSPTGSFARAYGRLTAYRPLGASWYGQVRVELGQVFKPADVAVPESQRFRAGGDESVRGYGYKELGPVTGGVVGSGNVLFTSSLELARPFSANLPSVWGAVFVDAGNAADSFGKLRPALGYGIGVRWRSPVGPLRLDWAYGREVRSMRVHFSVGIAF